MIPWSRRGALWLVGLAGIFLFSLLGTGVVVGIWLWEDAELPWPHPIRLVIGLAVVVLLVAIGRRR